MEVQGYVLEGISKLRCLSITEIVFGVLGALGLLANFARSHGSVTGSVGSLIVTVLLIAAGALGVHAVNKARSQVLDHSTFRICGILNIVLCVLYCLEMFVFVVAGILLAVATTSGLQLLEQFGMVESGTAEAINSHVELSRAAFGREVQVAVGSAIIVVLVVVIVICLLMIALTATAAKIARRNQAIILSAPSGAVAGYPLQPPGYTQYSAVKTQEVHHA